MTKYEAACEIIFELRTRGFEAYLVGGCVRDLLLGSEPKDYDITTNARPEEVEKVFTPTISIGKAFGVIIVGRGKPDKIWTEVATYRTDGQYSDGRRPDDVVFSTTAKDDVIRRDFTINGLLYDPIGKQVYDYVDGQNDLRIRMLRAIGDPRARFTEDPVRILRGVKFAYRLGLDIADRTLNAMIDLQDELRRVSRERIRTELLGTKDSTGILTLAHGPSRGRALSFLQTSGIMSMVISEIDALVGCTQPPEYHPEGDVFTHTQMMIAACKSQDPNLLMGLLLHDIGKPATRVEENGKIHFHGHADTGAAMAEVICERLKMERKDIDEIVYLVKWHMALFEAKNFALSTLKKFFRHESFPKLLELHRLDILCSSGNFESYDFLKHEFENMPPEVIKPEPLVDGTDLITLGFTPGPIFKTILGEVETLQLEGSLQTTKQALRFVVDKFGQP